jgi:hypothetical protein
MGIRKSRQTERLGVGGWGAIRSSHQYDPYGRDSMVHRADCLSSRRIRSGSFATEPAGFSVSRCPLCRQQRPQNCIAAIGRDGHNRK